MTTNAMQTFTALLALLALAGSFVFACARLSGRLTIVDVVRPHALWWAFVVAASSMLGSLYFSEVADYAPCKLCWYQRVAMYSLAIILLVAAIRRDRSVVPYAVPLAVIGLLVSTYHYLVEWFPTLETNVCSTDVPCTTVWFRTFGFVSLAFMAFCGFTAVVTVLLCTHQSEDTREEKDH